MKWATMKMKVIYGLMVIASLVMAAGADARWS